MDTLPSPATAPVSRETGRTRAARFTVWSLDVLGHSPADCHEHDCSCMVSQEPSAEAEKVFAVEWDNGNACGTLSLFHDTREAAEAYGNDWRLEMIVADADRVAAVDAYSFEIVEIDAPVEKEHNENKCRCGYDANDRSRVGTLDVEEIETERNVGTSYAFTSWSASDDVIRDALVSEGYVKAEMRERIGFDDVGDGSDIYIQDEKDGRPEFQLERETSAEDS